MNIIVSLAVLYWFSLVDAPPLLWWICAIFAAFEIVSYISEQVMSFFRGFLFGMAMRRSPDYQDCPKCKMKSYDGNRCMICRY